MIDFLELTIGKGDRLCSARAVVDQETKTYLYELMPEAISENAYCYWIRKCWLNTNLTVFKDTKQGRKIKKLIRERKFKELSKCIDKIVFEKITFTQADKQIRFMVKEAAKEGYCKCQEDTRKQLGIK